MAAKKKSGKTRGKDSGGQTFDLDNTAQYKAEVDRYFDARADRLRAQKQTQTQIPRSAAERTSFRNVVDYNRNWRSNNNARGIQEKGPFSMGPAKPDKLSGRTVEFGTRSMLEGMRGFMRGGGGLRSHGK
jgi:hypothetical protein